MSPTPAPSSTSSSSWSRAATRSARPTATPVPGPPGRAGGGHQIGSPTVDAVLGTLEAGQDVREVFDAVVWRHRGKKIAPKTVTQKRYVDSIRGSTVTFGIGPAGTGKTYLAMALAVAALHEREVARIILTRPAVEAGERL